MDLVAEFARRGPWITHFVIEGVATGGDQQLTNDRRVQQFLQCFPDVRTILELGSLEGAHTFTLARHEGVERVLAIEARYGEHRKSEIHWLIVWCFKLRIQASEP